ncbi:hypothetical protein [uncultured Aeromicrobium sp.]|uniref:hypothetical protein n=1 Tax=uncultured Aeromicrobium sp. TaxID=337820 RepID=UPI0025FC161C|nr:hypothetical protein [uncultured Aeromicrobium sp.]
MSFVVRALSTLAAAVTAVLVVSAGPAAASTAPSTWELDDPMSTLEVLAIFGGIPLALFVVISIFAAMTARNNFEPAPPQSEDDKENSEDSEEDAASAPGRHR